MMYGSFVKFLKSRLIGGCLATILLHLSIDGALCVGLVTEVSGNFVSTRRQSCMIWIAGVVGRGRGSAGALQIHFRAEDCCRRERASISLAW